MRSRRGDGVPCHAVLPCPAVIRPAACLCGHPCQCIYCQRMRRDAVLRCGGCDGWQRPAWCGGIRGDSWRWRWLRRMFHGEKRGILGRFATFCHCPLLPCKCSTVETFTVCGHRVTTGRYRRCSLPASLSGRVKTRIPHTVATCGGFIFCVCLLLPAVEMGGNFVAYRFGVYAHCGKCQSVAVRWPCATPYPNSGEMFRGFGANFRHLLRCESIGDANKCPNGVATVGAQTVGQSATEQPTGFCQVAGRFQLLAFLQDRARNPPTP